MECARLVESVICQSESYHGCSSIEDTRGPGWHWDPGGTTYHLPDMQIDYGIGGIIDPVVECTHLLGKF